MSTWPLFIFLTLHLFWRLDIWGGSQIFRIFLLYCSSIYWCIPDQFFISMCEQVLNLCAKSLILCSFYFHKFFLKSDWLFNNDLMIFSTHFKIYILFLNRCDYLIFCIDKSISANFILVSPVDVSCWGEGYAILNYDLMLLRSIYSLGWRQVQREFPFAFVWHLCILPSLGPM